MKFSRLFILDCKLLARNRMFYLKLLLFPAVIIAILGFVFSQGSDVKISPFTVALQNADRPSGASAADSLGSAFESDALQNSGVRSTIRVVDVSGDGEAKTLMKDGKASVYIRIPKDFTDQYLSGKPARIQVDTENASSVQKEMVHSIVQSFLQEANLRKNLGVATASEGVALHASDSAVQKALEKMNADTAQVDLPVQSPNGNRQPISSMQYYSMAITLMFSLLTAITLIHSIVDDKQNGTFLRILSMPIGRNEFILGKLLSVSLSVFFQMMLLIAFTSLVYRANWGNPGLVLFTTALYSLMAGALALLLGLTAENQTSVSSYSSLLLWGGGFLGGSFLKLDNIGGPLETIHRIIPNGAALEVYIGIANGNGMQVIGKNLLDVALFAAVFLILCAVSQEKRGASTNAHSVKSAA